VSQLVLLASSAPAQVQQDYLLQARQMQALSFAVHIPLVCFGIAFPALVLFVEWLYLRTGDELYRTLAKRWTKVMAALFAAGVVKGTILSFEMGLLWPSFTASFGSIFGLGFAIEGFSFFMEAIFIVYSRARIADRAELCVYKTSPRPVPNRQCPPSVSVGNPCIQGFCASVLIARASITSCQGWCSMVISPDNKTPALLGF
jgi:Cytochrome bd terminal oxidase subunit I